jgi:NAD(P)-dependent dehydrogenase (short-subunit alcohol dehydrogenase family)
MVGCRVTSEVLPLDPKNKVAVVVGGASGMARATAEALAARGCRVAIVDLPGSQGADVADHLGGGATFHAADVRDFEGVQRVLEQVVEAHGVLHIAVNTAGGGAGGRTISRSGPLSLDTFTGTVELNLVATFNLNRLQAWHMSQHDPDEDGERGVIINTSSIAAFEGQIGQVAYAAAKAGISAMSFVMARDLGSLGIRVNAIAPSLFATGSSASLPPEQVRTLVEDMPFPKRMGRPEEYAKMALAIVDNAMVNGSTIRLDGGHRFGPR